MTVETMHSKHRGTQVILRHLTRARKALKVGTRQVVIATGNGTIKLGKAGNRHVTNLNKAYGLTRDSSDLNLGCDYGRTASLARNRCGTT